MPRTATITVKSSVTRRQATATPEPADQAERELQAEHHQAAQILETATPAPAPAQAREPEPELSRRELKAHALQNGYLAACLSKPVVVFLMNGVKLTGKLRQFDQYCVLLEGPDGVNSLTFKHTISTIMSTCR